MLTGDPEGAHESVVGDELRDTQRRHGAGQHHEAAHETLEPVEVGDASP